MNTLDYIFLAFLSLAFISSFDDSETRQERILKNQYKIMEQLKELK